MKPYNTVEFWNDYYKQNRYVSWWPAENIVRFIANEKLRAGSERLALDFGSGNGRHLWLMAKEGFETHGVDISPVAIDLARKWMKQEGLSVKITLSTQDKISYRDNTFGLCVASSVLDYIPMNQALKTIKEIYRIMTPDARICITLKSTRDREFGMGKKIARNTYIVPDSELGMLIHFFDGQEIDELMAQFSDIQVECEERHVGPKLSYTWSQWVITGTK